MNTNRTPLAVPADALYATTNADIAFHAGVHAKSVPAGSLVWVRSTSIESDRPVVTVYLSSNARISAQVYRHAITPA